jgi:hypothetical protein
MKRAIYGTIILFVGILIVVYISSRQHPIREVKYENGRVVPKNP